MAYITIICKNCGRNLGRKTVPVFGIDPDFNGEKGIDYDPDCDSCNPYYSDKCRKCGQQRIDINGKCKVCGEKLKEEK